MAIIGRTNKASRGTLERVVVPDKKTGWKYFPIEAVGRALPVGSSLIRNPVLSTWVARNHRSVSVLFDVKSFYAFIAVSLQALSVTKAATLPRVDSQVAVADV